MDSGALIAFERGERPVAEHLTKTWRADLEVTVPTAVIAEVWRGGVRSARVAALLKTCIVEPLDEPLARSAGEALAAVSGASVVDAIVMASAATRGDYVLTSDYEDLDRLRTRFTEVRLVRL
jgi:predicted nucleic acid-binding protein